MGTFKIDFALEPAHMGILTLTNRDSLLSIIL
jgi:hypothetical protein